MSGITWSDMAGWIAEVEDADEETRRLSATAGLLHDIGKVAIAANLPKQFNEAQFHALADKVPFWKAEQQTLGATHSEVGGWMMCTWGLAMADWISCARTAIRPAIT